MWRRVEMGNETIAEKGCRSGKKPNDERTILLNEQFYWTIDFSDKTNEID